MTKVFIIISIVMWWFDPTATPTKDSVEITHKHGLRYIFLQHNKNVLTMLMIT